jgi:beta-lactamase superfamily II metal-dependent hydrolase
MTRTDPPKANELEISLFGPGIGECAVVHLCDDEWMIVDSCRSIQSGNSVALDYLSSLGVDISTRVKHVVISHWHDDHIDGMAGIVREAVAAKVTCSGALHCSDFLALLGHPRCCHQRYDTIEERASSRKFLRSSNRGEEGKR